MKSTAFSLVLLGVATVALWLLLHMIINTDPDTPLNLVIGIFAAFLTAGSVAAALSLWTLARRWKEPKRYQIAVREGVWVGLLVAIIMSLRVFNLLSWLVAGALVLIFGGLEALLLLQPETSAKRTTDPVRET